MWYQASGVIYFLDRDARGLSTNSLSTNRDLNWTPEAELELSRIPGFVRGKIKRNTEIFVKQKGIVEITVSVMYAAKASNFNSSFGIIANSI